MYASFLPEGDLTKYTLPIVSVSGDLDGQTRLTRVVKAYRYIKPLYSMRGILQQEYSELPIFPSFPFGWVLKVAINFAISKFSCEEESLAGHIGC